MFLRTLIVSVVVCASAGCATGELKMAAGRVSDAPFRNWQNRHFAAVVRQQTDFTCGAASLSTISEHYFGRPISEKQFTNAMRKRYSDETWREKEIEGLSLLDMKLAAESLGFKAEGVKMSIDDAVNLSGPIIVHLDKGYVKHFSVLQGVRGDRAFLADPIIGHVRVPLYRFRKQWTGYALAVWVDGADLPVDHRLTIKAADLTNEKLAARRSLYTQPPPPIANGL
jgi:predicted double-glycine peptidase